MAKLTLLYIPLGHCCLSTLSALMAELTSVRTKKKKEVASSSSSDLPNLPALSSTSAPSANPSTQLVFKYGVDEAVLKTMERGKLYEWTNVEFRAICKKHGLSVRGAKGDLMGRVTAHFQQVYQV